MKSRVISILCLCLIFYAQLVNSISFTPLGFGGNAVAISGDGSVVAGNLQTQHGLEAYIWDATNGLMPLGSLSGGRDYSIAWDISSDGLVVVGTSSSSEGFQAYKWDATNGMVGLGDLEGGENTITGTVNSRANGVSLDGSMIVGAGTSYVGTEAFIWDEINGMVGMNDFMPAGTLARYASDVSADGTVVVGIVDSPNHDSGFIWSATEGLQTIRNPISQISDNGLVAAGWGCGEGGCLSGYVWTQTTGVTVIDEAGIFPHGSPVMGLSADGSVAVGMGFYGYTHPNDDEAYIWTQDEGLQLINDLLEDNGLDLTGWRFTTASGVSDDGLTIVGDGINPSGNHESWVINLATIPEPTTLALMGLGLAGIGYRRRRSKIAA